MTTPLTLNTYRFTFQAQEEIRMPVFAGSAWRGLFGHSLRRTVCVTGQRTCAGCLLADQCAYTRIFEPEQQQAHQTKDRPRPYVFFSGSLEAGKEYLYHRPHMQAGDYFGVDLTLINHANRDLPYIIHALQTAGQRGIGLQLVQPDTDKKHSHARPRRGRFQLQRVDRIGATKDANPIYTPDTAISTTPNTDNKGLAIPPSPAGKTLTLKFITPLRLRLRAGMLGPENFDFAPFFAAVLRRTTSFADNTITPENFHQLTRLAQQVSINDNQLRWHKQRRYSSRQRQTINLSGVTGQLTLAAPRWDELWPFLWQGQFLHVGKSACMGMGKYLICGEENRDFLTKLFEKPNFPERPLQVLDFSAKITPDESERSPQN